MSDRESNVRRFRQEIEAILNDETDYTTMIDKIVEAASDFSYEEFERVDSFNRAEAATYVD